jgi:hypothetical protein
MNEEPKKQISDMGLVGINVAVLVIYTVFCKFSEGGIILDAFLIFAHVIVCFIVAITQKNWFWFLSGLLVLIVGFSTCANFLHM